MVECKSCGSPVGTDWRFCRRCGSPIAAASQDEVATRTLEPRAETLPGSAPPTGAAYLPPHYHSYPTGAGHPPLMRPERRSGWRVALVIIGVLLMGAAGGGAFYFLKRDSRPVVFVSPGPPEPPGLPPPPPRPPGPSLYAGEGFTKVFPLASGSEFRLTNLNGNVTIATWDEEQAEVTARLRGGAPSDRDATRIKINPGDDSLSIETEPTRGMSVAVDYEIKLPREIAIKKLEVVNGNVTISGVEGDVKVEMVNGRIHIEDVEGALETNAVNGATEIILTRFRGDRLNVSSANGPIMVRIHEDFDADVQIDTVHGAISTEPSYGLRVEKNPIVGMKARGRIGDGGNRIKLESVNGLITFKR